MGLCAAVLFFVLTPSLNKAILWLELNQVPITINTSL